MQLRNIVLVLLFSQCLLICYSQENVLFEDNFENRTDSWKDIILNGTDTAETTFNADSLSITTLEGQTGGIYNTTAINGHFTIDIDFYKDEKVMLLLFHSNSNGKADIQNYSALCVNEIDGKTTVYLTDKQNGNEDVLDNTFKTSASDYSHTLDGNTFSLPFVGTGKSLRIKYNSLSGFFHFYYKVSGDISGQTKEDWIELFPSRKWGNPGSYLVGIMATGGTASYKSIKVTTSENTDQSDLSTGFEVKERNYTWSGYNGKATVVSFDDDFAYNDKDYKWVFWEKSNYVPAWHLSNDLHYTYEFVETWNGGYEGCHEPMSDRLKRWSEVEVLENNHTRKVIKWKYALINPDYNYPYDWEGEQIPEAEEIYIIYPDGQIVRQIKYIPKLDTEFRKWHELTELIIIAGVRSNPSDHLSSPALSVFNEKYKFEQFHSSGDGGHFYNDSWDSYICATHFKDHPDAINAFIQEEGDGKKMFMDISWHTTQYKFTHWPVNKVVYKEPCKTFTNWKGMVSHTSLLGGGVSSGTDWNSNYQYENGRKFREWNSLIFLNEPGQIASSQQMVSGWNSPGEITLTSNGNVYYDEYLRKEKCIQFINSTSQPENFSFELEPDSELSNIVIRVKSWGKKAVTVKVNGTQSRNRHWVYDNEDLLIWLPITGDDVKNIEIIASEKDFTNISDIPTTSNFDAFPNPVRKHINLTFQESCIPDTIEIINDLGKRVEIFRHIHSQMTINVSDYPPGVYHIRTNNSEKSDYKRFLVYR